MVHDDVPVVGRAVTAKYSPTRPDIEALIKERGKKKGALEIRMLGQFKFYKKEMFMLQKHLAK